MDGIEAKHLEKLWEERFYNLESRVSYQDRLLAELDEVVRESAQRVDQLQRRVVELQDSVGDQEFGPGDDKPPHY